CLMGDGTGRLRMKPASKKERPDERPRDITQLLVAAGQGHQEALDQLMPMVYEELRRLADNYLRRERGDHTLQATALVHEAYLQLVDQKEARWQNRVQFFGIAARLMRQILVQHARSHQAAKRGGPEGKLSLDEALELAEEPDLDLTALDEALGHLSAIDPQQG